MSNTFLILRLFVIMLVVFVVKSQSNYRRGFVGDNHLLKILNVPERPKLFTYVVPKNGPGWLVSCARGRGLCVTSNACPWERMLTDDREDCLQDDYPSCCYVTPSSMPRDMFEAYD